MEQTVEMLDVVDMTDSVVGETPRKGVHNTNNLHRSVHIFLVSLDGKIWLEKRGMNTDTYPGYYSSSAAGHVRKGESYMEGAVRESIEELGIEGLKFDERGKLNASQKTSNEFVTFFVAESDKIPREHEDTQKLEAFSVEQIRKMITDGQKFTPIFMELFRLYSNSP